MRICVLSNSHAASLYGPAADVEKDTGCVFTFFAAPNRGMRHLVVDKNSGRLTAIKKGIQQFLSLTSGGLKYIDSAEYDAFLLHGLFVTPPRFDIRHSEAFREAATKDMLAVSESQRLTKILREVSVAPILISPEPFPADFEDNDEDKILPTAYAPKKPQSTEAIYQGMSDNFLGSGVHWLRQDPNTIGGRLNTQRSFSTGSGRLKQGDQRAAHKERDVRHMNEKYGEIVLRMACEKVKEVL